MCTRPDIPSPILIMKDEEDLSGRDTVYESESSGFLRISIFPNLTHYYLKILAV